MPDQDTSSVEGWEFEVDEVSANVYRIEGSGPNGESVEMTGTEINLDEMLEECKKYARSVSREKKP